MKKEEATVRTILADTIVALCRNTLGYRAEICVEGLLGITIDNEEIFLVNVKETIRKPGVDVASETEENLLESEENSASDSQQEDRDSKQKRRRRKRRRKSKDNEDSGSAEDNVGDDGLEKKSRLEAEYSVEAGSNQDSTDIKQEDDEILFIKEEPGENSDNSSFGHSHSMLGSSSQYQGASSRDGLDTSMAAQQLQHLTSQLSQDLAASATSSTVSD